MRLLHHFRFDSFLWDTWHFHLVDDACWVERPIPDKIRKNKQYNGSGGYRSPCPSHAKRVLYHLSYTPFRLMRPDVYWHTMPTCTPTPQTDAKTVWPSGLRRLTWNQLSSGCVGSNPATVVFFFIPEQLHLCVSDGVDTDDQSKQDNVAEWLRRLPAKEFPFGA